MLKKALIAATLLLGGCNMPAQPRQPFGNIIPDSNDSAKVTHEDDALIKVREYGVRAGFGRGKLSTGDLAVLTAEAHVGFDVNYTLGIDRKFGNFTSTVTVVANSIQDPDVGIEIGGLPGLKYSYPVTDWVEPYIEGQAGTIYYGIDTREQGKAGFEFLNQFGGGLEIEVADEVVFTAGYRFRHISNCSSRSPNREINSHGAVWGILIRH